MKADDRYLLEDVVCRFDGLVRPVANLSVGGFFVVSDQPPIPTQVLELELVVGDRPPFRVLGKVCWINDPRAPRAKDLPQGFGVKITQIAFPDKLAIVAALKRASPDTLHRGGPVGNPKAPRVKP
jgi:hypothetical protein